MKVIKAFPTTESPALRAMHGMPSRIALHVAEGIVLLSWNEIQYCSAESNYTHVYATGGRHYLLSKTLGQIEARLPAGSFMRIHQSHLVNLGAIDRIGNSTVRMHDQKELRIARGKRKLLLAALDRIAMHI